MQGRLTLLLGPPGSGKSTLLKALAGKLGGKSPQITGKITYNGETFSSFVPQRTAAYVSQVSRLSALSTEDLLLPPDFAHACHRCSQGRSQCAAEHIEGPGCCAG